jgi:chromosome segregation ATPase
MDDTKDISGVKIKLASLKKDLENVNSIQERLDNAIDKLTDVSSSIKSMLAVHEEKITRQEKMDEIIFDKIRDRADEIESVYKELKRDIELSEKRLLCEIKSLKNDIGARVGILEKIPLDYSRWCYSNRFHFIKEFHYTIGNDGVLKA